MTDQPNALPRLRDDLQWTLHQFAAGASYTVLDPTSGLTYQVGLAEHALASTLDGRTSLAEAAEATETLALRSGRAELAVDADEAELIADWLIKMQLAVTGDADPTAPNRGRLRRTHVSALSIKMPLADPGRIVETLAKRVRPLTTRAALHGCLLAITVALFHVLCDLGRWSAALRPLADAHAWWILGAVAIALRVLHEAAHAVVAHRLGVRVGEVGILWILFMPLPYVDVSQSWLRNRRGERILIAAAGMLAEMFIAALAVFLFTWSSSELVQHLAAMVAVTASVVTLLFNANVLMRFDGYHILVDALGLPNLYSDASNYWRNTAARVILGKQVARSTVASGWLGVFVRIYGAAAAVWRVAVLVGLILAAEHLFAGAGVLLGIAAVIGVVVRQLRGLPRLLAGARPARALAGITATAAVLVACWYLPVSRGRTETGVVRYSEPSQVRAAADGFLREVLVQRGQFVRRGDPLAVMANAALASEVATMRLELAAAELRYRQFLSQDHMASVDAQRSAIIQRQRQLAQRVDQLESLTIRADTDGTISGPDDLARWLGRFVGQGTELMRIVHSDDMEIVLLVDQQSRASWSRYVGRKVRVRRPMDWNDDQATLSDVAPRATDRLASETLGAHLGGPHAVRASASPSEPFRLLRRRFETRVHPVPQSDFRDGERVRVTLETGGTTIGKLVSDSAGTWIRDRIARHSLLHQWSNF